jgi:hypothetical protein
VHDRRAKAAIHGRTWISPLRWSIVELEPFDTIRQERKAAAKILHFYDL